MGLTISLILKVAQQRMWALLTTPHPQHHTHSSTHTQHQSTFSRNPYGAFAVLKKVK
uniref:Uncharacterized protein n=1 Tax=Glycine max TaxID=3847 RepID=C6TEA7_SOYBN|nr:unknown [Glycine max]